MIMPYMDTFAKTLDNFQGKSFASEAQSQKIGRKTKNYRIALDKSEINESLQKCFTLLKVGR